MTARTGHPARGMLAAVLVAVAIGGGLRLWDLGRPDLTFDEAFSFSYARMPVGEIPGALREDDAHPPLDYLLRHPIASRATTPTGLRVPSVMFSLAAVAATAGWLLRDRRWVGVAIACLMAVAPFQVGIGRNARMYAAMVLFGVLAAWLATRWLERPTPRIAMATGAVLLLALWTHASALFLGAGLLAVVGWRGDRDAWWWRASLAVAGGLWALTWGPAFLDQLDATSDSWIPYTTLSGVARTVNELVDSYRAAAWLGLAVVAAGGVFVVRDADAALRRVWLCCFVLPVVLAAVVGLRTHSLLPRTLAFASWGPLVALVFLVDAARRRWMALGVAAAVLVGLLLLPSIVAAPWRERRVHEAAFAYVEAHARPSDALAVHPRWLGPLVEWRLAARGADDPRARPMPVSMDATAATPGPAWSGRVWLVEPVTYKAEVVGFRPCAEPLTRGSYRVRCLDRTSDAAG